MTISASDLPKSTSGTVVFDLDDCDQLKVCLLPEGGYYGEADKFDFEAATAEEAVAKLNRWGASVAGWE